MNTTTDSRPPDNRRGLWWIKVILGGVVALVAIAIVFFLIAGARAKAELQAAHPPPGQLVDVSGYQMHIDCQGEGSPTVILEAGAGQFSPYWVRVQPEVAEYTRVCAYDRAGLGWSEASPEPRTAGNIVVELHTLLAEAGIPGPYVLVGHSLGGVYVRLYAHEYPGEVAGMVLVDSSHEEQNLRAPEALRQGEEESEAQRKQQLSVARTISAVGLMAMAPENVPSEPELPPATGETVRALIAANPEYFDTRLAVADNSDGIFEEARGAKMTTLGDIPLVVIAAGRQATNPSVGLTEELAQQYAPVWRQMQTELAQLSTNGELVIAEESGHNIHLEQPGMVIDAIRQVVEAVRRQ